MRMTKSTDVEFTFFVPCLNEENNIVNAIETIVSVSNELKLTYEIIIIDDNSKDNTLENIKVFIEGNEDVDIKLFKNTVTKGLGYNYTEGAYKGSGNYYMLVNGDNSEKKETLQAILGIAGATDMIIPYFYSTDNRKIFRIITSKLFTFIINLISGNSIKYYNGPVLHHRYNVMRHHSDTHGFAYQAELIVKLLDQNKSYSEVVVLNQDRDSQLLKQNGDKGKSKAFTIVNILSVLHSITQIILRKIRKNLYGF